mgnify:CR=1 FL=1
MNISVMLLKSDMSASLQWYALQRSDIILSRCAVAVVRHPSPRLSRSPDHVGSHSRSNFAETAALSAFLTSPSPLSADSPPPPPRGLFVEGHSNASLADSPEEAGRGIEGWWYWCSDKTEGVNRRPSAGMERVREEWCARWRWP